MRLKLLAGLLALANLQAGIRQPFAGRRQIGLDPAKFLLYAGPLRHTQARLGQGRLRLSGRLPDLGDLGQPVFQPSHSLAQSRSQLGEIISSAGLLHGSRRLGADLFLHRPLATPRQPRIEIGPRLRHLAKLGFELAMPERRILKPVQFGLQGQLLRHQRLQPPDFRPGARRLQPWASSRAASCSPSWRAVSSSLRLSRRGRALARLRFYVSSAVIVLESGRDFPPG
jgi:hypothetical protein